MLKHTTFQLHLRKMLKYRKELRVAVAHLDYVQLVQEMYCEVLDHSKTWGLHFFPLVWLVS